MSIQNLGNNRKKVLTLISATILLAVFVTATIILWKPFTDTFQKPDKFRMWVNSHGVWGRLAFIGIASLQVLFAFIPGEPLELAAGYAFSTFEGTALCLLGDAIGSSVIFLLTKKLGMKILEILLSREKIRSLHFLQDSKNLNLLIFVLFFIPGTPKDIITYVVGLTPMKLRTFLLLTSIARIPSILTSAMAGDALGIQDYKAAIIVYAVTGIVSLAGIFIYHKITKHFQKNKAENIPQERT
ncbi:TVP38/TMEM64 family protein [Muricomes intestini]|jgi:uncharacterized membrane protein YdjX (TVP38/TMEM64 family)|uniref:TVP38/TMEM64 family protein n=1 Tax=Muricomes intestini TaxID=1796634 RepID=UPI002FE30A97